MEKNKFASLKAEVFPPVLCKCADCDKPTEAEAAIYGGEERVICEDCDQFYEWCEICQSHNYSYMQSPCRHLFWQDDLWQGAGAYEGDWEYVKPHFMSMLDLIGPDAAQSLLYAIEQHRYHFQFHGNLLSFQGCYVTLLGEDGKFYRHNQMFSVFWDYCDSPHEYAKLEYAAAGIEWLMSLWSGDINQQEVETEAADNATVTWIKEYMKQNA